MNELQTILSRLGTCWERGLMTAYLEEVAKLATEAR